MHRVVAGFSGLMLADDQATIAVMEVMLAEVRAGGALTWIPYAQEVVALAQALRGDFLTAQTCLAEAVALSTEFGMDMEVAVLRAASVWLAAVTGDEPRCRELAAEVLPVLEGRHAVGTALTSLGPRPARSRRGTVRRGVRRAVRRVRGTGQVRLPHPRGPGSGGGGGPRRPPRPRSPISSRRSNGGPCTWTVRSRPRCCDAARRCSMTRRSTTGRHSTCTSSTAAGSTRPEPSCCTANGYAADAAAARHEPNWPPLWPDSRGWARRPGKRAATSELTALGERPTLEPVADDPLKNLTPQEVQVVRLAAAGLSNKEIGAQLFLSPRTIGHHLYRAYPKLGVTRRIELAQLGLG